MQSGTAAKGNVMSVQAGIWNFDGKPVDPKLLDNFSQALKQQGPDGEFCHSDGSIALLYRPFHTTADSRREKQPYVSRRGFVMTWDGRLDNRKELAFDLGHDATGDATDVEVFAAAFDRWESQCFRRIIGDWAASIWKPQERELMLVCDFMAVRHIFYYLKNDRVWWSTDLTPLILLSGNKFHINDEYIAGYFGHDPEAALTPYREIRQVPAAQFVVIRNGTTGMAQYWSFSPKSHIQYKTDLEYEEDFQYLFRQSIRRRLRSDSPILAELSGGLDSSSIVCMADDLLAKEGAGAPRLDTISYFDQTEPNGDDWIYFTEVEQKRGKIGFHIDASRVSNCSRSLDSDTFQPWPTNIGWFIDLETERAAILRAGSYRVVLSGKGGDEFLGGIPDPSSQLADLIAQFKFISVVRLAAAWSLAKRQPFIKTLYSASAVLVAPVLGELRTRSVFESWVHKRFHKKTRITRDFRGVDQHGFLCLPSRYRFLEGVNGMANSLAKTTCSKYQLEEVTYPFLDRDLLAFLGAIPETQLLRPGERRSMMRRSLAGIVPPKILDRRTKQFGARTPVRMLSHHLTLLETLFSPSISSSMDYINDQRFLDSLAAAGAGKEIHTVRLLKTVSLELWLRFLASRDLIELINSRCSHDRKFPRQPSECASRLCTTPATPAGAS
jgi:asparagine synthase (glutamine-hydrolysing)